MRKTATASLPRKPITPAAATAPKALIGWRFDQSLDRLVGGEEGREQDQPDDDQPGEILGAMQSEGEARAGRTAGQDESHDERQRRQRIAKLWMVSASRATEPLMMTITTCSVAVSPSPASDHFGAHNPRALDRQ